MDTRLVETYRGYVELSEEMLGRYARMELGLADCLKLLPVVLDSAQYTSRVREILDEIPDSDSKSMIEELHVFFKSEHEKIRRVIAAGQNDTA